MIPRHTRDDSYSRALTTFFVAADSWGIASDEYTSAFAQLAVATPPVATTATLQKNSPEYVAEESYLAAQSLQSGRELHAPEAEVITPAICKLSSELRLGTKLRASQPR